MLLKLTQMCEMQSSRQGLHAGLVEKNSQEGALWLNGLVFGGIPGGPQTALMRGVSEEMRTLQVLPRG